MGIWLASTGERQESTRGLDFKMRVFLTVVTMGCFMFSTFTGASVHTLIESRLELERSKAIAAAYFSLSLKALSEVNI